MAEADVIDAPPMRAKEPRGTKRSPWRWLVRGLLVLLGLLLLAIVGGYLFLRSGAGLSFVEEQVEAQDLPFVGPIELDGLDGNLFDALTIDEIVIKDQDGPWLIIRDLAVDYTLLNIRNRHIDIDTLSAREVEVLRAPTLLEEEPSESPPPRTTIERFVAERVILREELLGQEAELTASGTFAFREDFSTDLELDADRLDAPGEGLDLDFSRAADGTMTGDFDVQAPAGGPIATLMRAPEGVDVTGNGELDGDLQSGDGELVLRFDERTVVDAKTDWTPERATATGTVAVGAWPAFDAVSARTGDTLDMKAELDRTTDAFNLDVGSADFTLSADGVLPEEGGVPESANITLVSDTPAKLLSLPEGYRFGRVRAEGVAGSDLSFDGNIALSAVATPFFDAGTIRSPLTVKRREDGSFDIATDTRLQDLVTKQALPIDLSDEAVLNAVLRLNPDTQAVTLQRLKLESGSQTLSANGMMRYGEPLSYDVEGRADVRLNAVGAAPPGRLVADYDIQSVDGLTVPAVTAEGSFQPQFEQRGEVQAPLADLLGERANFDIAMEPLADGALSITRGRVVTSALRAAVSGRVGDTLDIDGEVAVSETVDLGTAVVGEGAQASFTVTGTREDPNARLDASLPTLEAGGQSLQDVRVRADVRDLLSNPKGPVQIDAQTEYGPLTASAQLASQQGLYAATDIDISLGQLSAGGDLRVVGDGLYAGRIGLNLPEDGDSYARALLVLEPVNGEQGIVLDADAREVSVYGYDIATLTADARGTLAGLSGNIEVRGREDALISEPFALDGPFELTRENERYTFVISPEGEFEGLEFSPNTPLTVSYRDGAIAASGDLNLGGGSLAGEFYREGTEEALDVTLRDLPLQTFPLPVGLGETQGTLRGQAQFASGPGQPPSGSFDLTLADWRGRLADEGEGLSLDMRGALEAGRLEMTLDDGGNTTFSIDGAASIPLVRAATLTALRPDMTAPFTATLTAGGPAAPLFNLAAPEDSNPRGTLSLDVRGSGTLSSPDLNGTANGQAIGFEAPVAGTRIRNGRFAASFTRDTVTITDVFANDGGKGTLAGDGRFALGGNGVSGELQLRANSFKALDRADYEARVDGTVGYRADGELGTVTGDIKIDKAEVKQFAMGGAKVVNLVIDEVVGERTNPNRVEVQRQQIPVRLDVRVRAPREIFIRARGINLESRLDLTITGTVSEPLVRGTAEVVRGGIELAGKEIEFEEGEITFNGPIPAARINLVARTETPSIDATVTVTGTVETPEIELSSTPDRPDDEILSALLFGRSATQLSALEAAQLAGALATLSGSGGGFDLVGGLRDALGFSSLNIGMDEDGQALVSGGRYLARDVYLELFSGTDSNASGAIISWEVRPNIVLRTQLSADNEQAFAVLYKKDF